MVEEGVPGVAADAVQGRVEVANQLRRQRHHVFPRNGQAAHDRLHHVPVECVRGRKEDMSRGGSTCVERYEMDLRSERKQYYNSSNKSMLSFE